VYREPAPEVWQTECRLAIAAVGGSDQREQGGILRNGHQRTVAKRPTHWGEVPAEHPNFTNKWL
jgi:hypothetical protein